MLFLQNVFLLFVGFSTLAQAQTTTCNAPNVLVTPKDSWGDGWSGSVSLKLQLANGETKFLSSSAVTGSEGVSECLDLVYAEWLSGGFGSSEHFVDIDGVEYFYREYSTGAFAKKCDNPVAPIFNYETQQCEGCPAGEYLNLAASECVSDCGLDYINATGNACVISCAANEFIDSEGTQCISECPSGTHAVDNHCCSADNYDAGVCTKQYTFQPLSRDELETAVNSCLSLDGYGATCCATRNGLISSQSPCPYGTIHISSWDTSAVTDMSKIFYRKDYFNANIGAWNTSAVTTMHQMFYKAMNFDQDIGGWDTSAVTDMSSMFYDARMFNQEIEGWDTGAVITMKSMFHSADIFNQNIGGWNTGAVKNMANMFRGSIFNKDIGGWDTSSVTDMSYMFYFNQQFNQDIGAWNVGAATNMHFIFYYAKKFDADISCWNIQHGSPYFPTGSTPIHGTCKSPWSPNCGDTYQFATDCVDNIPSGKYLAAMSSTQCVSECPYVDGCEATEIIKEGTANQCVSACSIHLDQAGCCAQFGCSFSNGDCIDTSALAGKTDKCTVPCNEDEHVVNHVCTVCPTGKTKPAGDLPRTNSDCWDAGSCGGVKCVDSNTESCTDNICVCKSGFGGSACDKDVTAGGLQEMLKKSRKKALPSRQDLLERQKTIKSFARDTLKQKLRQGKSVKQAINETRIAIAPSDLPQRSQMIVQLLNKAPVVAVAPKNKDTEDTCAQGADTAGCSMVDLSDDGDEITILSTDPEPGSWSVLSSGGAITSKQTRVSEFEYEMQCWDNGWGEKETVDVSDGAQLYACNGNVIMVASQSGICTPTTCNNGNCTIDGSSYTCSCEAGWSGDHCDQVATNSQCYEFDCSNYGGHKTLEHCGGSCSASVCCNHATKAAFNTVCDGLSSAADYVNNNCCHRDICI